MSSTTTSAREIPRQAREDGGGEARDDGRQAESRGYPIGVAAGVALLIALSAAGKRKEKKQLKEIQRLLAATR